MSLQVWLPLNGNLNNQGLDGSGKFNIIGTFVDKGKISSKAYNCTQQATATFNSLIGVTNYSVSYWVYIDSSLTFTNYTDMWGIQFNIGSSTAYMRDELRNSAGLRAIHMAKDASVGSNTYTYYGLGNRDDAKDKWSHVVLVKDDTKAYQYVNGSLIGTYNASNWESNPGKMTGAIYIGQNGCSSYLNDFRIYDHCLSQKEINELAKGLVLHYKLTGISKGQDNILVNTHFDLRTTQTAWDTTKNGTLTANSWGGYNSGVSNATTKYHAHLKLVDGVYVYEYIKTSDETWLGVSQGGLQNKLTAGTSYTFSWDQYCVEGGNYAHGGLYYYKTGATSAGFHIGSFSGKTGRKLGEWQHFKYTFTAPSDGDYSKGMSWYIYGTNGGNGIFYIKNFKLELGDKDTPWTPYPTDVAYTALGLDENTIEEDCSGYSHDGTKTGSLTLSSDTPRYATSTVFNGSSYITVQNNDYAIQGIEEMSCSVWAYDDDWSTYSGRIYSCTEGGGINIEQSGTKLQWAINAYSNAEKTSYSYPSSLYITIENSTLSPGWHLFTWTYTTEGTKVYVDGVLKVTKTATSYGIHFNNTAPLIIGGEATATGATTPYLTGKLSDFRIYATALSADDVKELYQTSASIDNQGNLHTYEVVER